MSDLINTIVQKIDKLDDKIDILRDNQTVLKTFIENHENKDEERHAEMRSSIKEMKEELADYNLSLREHMRRTEILEQAVVPMHKEWVQKQAVYQHTAKKWKMIIAVIGGLATTVGLVIAIIELMSMIQ